MSGTYAGYSKWVPIIGLCDDAPHEISELKEVILRILDRQGKEAHIQEFSSGRQLLQEASFPDILFLDIDMPEMDGIEVGRRLLSAGAQCRIIMATGMENRIKEAFKIRALRYVSKPFDETEVREALLSALNSFVGTKEIILYSNRTPHRIRQQDIGYVRAFDGYCRFKVADREFRLDTSISALMEELDSRIFYRLSRSLIVNLQHVNCTERCDVLTINGTRIVVPRRAKAAFRSAYIDYSLKYQ